jgi:REP element-mobilizing transposase RayT
MEEYQSLEPRWDCKYHVVFIPKKRRRENFWARGFFISTFGLDEEIIRSCIRNQEKKGERHEQLRIPL